MLKVKYRSLFEDFHINYSSLHLTDAPLVTDHMTICTSICTPEVESLGSRGLSNSRAPPDLPTRTWSFYGLVWMSLLSPFMHKQSIIETLLLAPPIAFGKRTMNVLISPEF